MCAQYNKALYMYIYFWKELEHMVDFNYVGLMHRRKPKDTSTLSLSLQNIKLVDSIWRKKRAKLLFQVRPKFQNFQKL